MTRSIDKYVHVDVAITLIEDQTSRRAINGDVRANAFAGRAIAAAELNVVDALLGNGVAPKLKPRNDSVNAASRSLAGHHPKLAIVLNLVGRMAVGQCQIPHLRHDRSGGVLELQPHSRIATERLGQRVEQFVRAHVVLETNWIVEKLVISMRLTGGCTHSPFL